MFDKAIVLIGDSTLDNCVWVRGGPSIAEQLRNELGSLCRPTTRPSKKIRTKTRYLDDDISGLDSLAGSSAQLPSHFEPEFYKVVNLSADAFTTSDVLNGNIPRISYAERLLCDPFHLERGCFYPLKELARVENPSHVILSIGGNDFRCIIHKLCSRRGCSILESTLRELTNNYIEILNKIKSNAEKTQIVLVKQYLPCRESDDYGIYEAMQQFESDWFESSIDPAEKLHTIINYTFEEILRLSEIGGISISAVIDLNEHFDPRESALYEHQIEPSVRGGKLIARLIANEVKKNVPHYKNRKLVA